MNGRDRAGIWFAMLAAERERRRLLALSPPAAEVAAELIDTLEQMAGRLLGAPLPGDAALAKELMALAREKDDAGLEAVRLKYDLAPAEVVAWLIAAGDGEAALEVLGRYAALMPAFSGGAATGAPDKSQ
jgi:hypothetical protein